MPGSTRRGTRTGGRRAIGAVRCFQRNVGAPETRKRDQPDVPVAAGCALEELYHACVGTHIGVFEGIPASQRHVRVPYAVAYDVEDAGIRALRLYFPMDQLLRQIGAEEAVGARV